MDYANAFLAHRVRDDARIARWSVRILAHAPPGGAGLAVDVGCGVGRFTQAMADSFANVVGIDRDQRMLALAAERVAPKAMWIAADATRLPLANRCAHFVLASMVLEHVTKKCEFFAEVSRVLASGGVLALRTMLPDDIDATGWYAASSRAREVEHLRTLSLDALTSLAAQAGLVLASAERVVETVGVDAQLAPLPMRLRERSYEALRHLNEDELAHAVATSERLTAAPAWREALASSLLLFTHRA